LDNCEQKERAKLPMPSKFKVGVRNKTQREGPGKMWGRYRSYDSFKFSWKTGGVAVKVYHKMIKDDVKRIEIKTNANVLFTEKGQCPKIKGHVH